ncbi:hypothetical protein C8R44DRAFT_787489, partial [Mycena epipterygia]
MDSKISARLSASGAGTIFTNLEGHSDPARQRAQEGGHAASYTEIFERATCVFSGLQGCARRRRGHRGCVLEGQQTQRQIIFWDCNAVNLDSVKWMA